MIGKKMAAALNDQLNKEIYSAYLYMSMSAYSTHIGLKGIAKWFMVQYHEEMSHAMRIYDYIHDQGNQVQLMAIDGPPTEFGTPLEMFQKTLKHEKFVTKRIHDLVDLAIQENDNLTQSFLKWFVDEQVEEEENDNKIIDMLKPAADSRDKLLAVDEELAKRVFKP